MNISEPWVKGWQLLSLRDPSVVARTWAKMRLDVVLEARRERLMQFQAGVVEVKMQGDGPRVGGV
jgi:hypothetical protein